MGKEFYETSPQAKSVFDAADKVIQGLSSVLFNGPAEKLTSTRYCQPGIFTYSIAAYEALKAHPKFKSIHPKFACGLSLGECTAVCAAGALSFEDALKMVERRATFMEEACRLKKGAMAAVIGFPAKGGSASGGDKDALMAICKETGAQVANFNSPDQIVITGEAANVEAASVKIKEAGAKRVIPLDVGGAFHSSLMRPAVPKFEAELNKFIFKPPQFAVVSNVDGRPSIDPKQTHQNLAKQITSSVQWVMSVENIARAGVKTFLEIGPGTVLKGLIRKINPELIVYSIQKPNDLDVLPF